MAACVLAMLVVAPTLGMTACLCDERAPVVDVATSNAAVQADPKDHRTPCEAACCVGGHCHHGGAMLDTTAEGILARAPDAAEHALPAARILASRDLSGLDRPPRA
jgi:hypothetical protein